MKKLLVILFVIFEFLLIQPKITNAEDLTNQFKITVQSDKTSNVEINFNLKDQTGVNFLTGFELTFPMEVSADGISGSINNQNVTVSPETTDGKTTLKLATENLTVDLKSDAWLKLNFKVPSLIKEKFGVDYLYLPAITSNFGLGNLTYDVITSQGFKKASYVSAQAPNFKNDNEFTAITNKSLFVIWGDTPIFNLKMDYNLKNSNSTDTPFLVNVASNVNQDVSYNNFPKVDGGVYDSLTNNFAIVNVTGNKTTDVSLDANVTLNNVKKVSQTTDYGWSLNQTSTFGLGFIDSFKNQPDAKSKIQAIDKYLVDNLDPNSDEKFDLSSLNTIWDKLNGSTQLNSFEYCYLAVAAGNYLGFNGAINYGYLILPDFLLSEKRTPHVWCELNDGTQSYFLDPFLEDQFKLDYNFIQPPDRVKFGTWQVAMTYNNLLGLASNDSDAVLADIAEVSQVPVSAPGSAASNKIDYDFQPGSDDLHSGDFYSADISINNKSKYFLELKDVKIDDTSYISTLAVQNFYPALLPEKGTVFTFSNLIQSNVFYNGSKDVSIKSEVDNPNFKAEDLASTKNLFFKINVLNILKELFVIAIFIGLGFALYKFFIKKRLSKFLKK